jgi:hypothetical protein
MVSIACTAKIQLKVKAISKNLDQALVQKMTTKHQQKCLKLKEGLLKTEVFWMGSWKTINAILTLSLS